MSLHFGYVQSLFRRGGSFGPRPTLDLNFMGGSIGSQVTFSRGTKAMRYGSDGTLQYGPHNLLLQSQTFDNASWTLFGATPPVVTPNLVAAPDGTMTADRISFPVTGSGSRIQQVLSTSAINTVSIYLRGTVGGEQIQVWNGWSSLNQTVTLTTSWQRFAFTESALNASTGIYLYAAVGTPTIYAWGGQVSEGSIPGEYQATTTAAVYGPRFDYNPATLLLRGLLIEEQRTNGIRNNTAQGAVAGTPGTFPNFWLGFLNSITGVAFSIVGTGVEKGINYVDIRMNGTPSATVPQGLQITFEGNSAIAASASQTWTQSLWLSVVGGSTANITGFFHNIQQYNLGAFVAENNVAITPNSTLTRYSGTVTFTAATTTNALPLIGLGVTSGAAVDITIRIGLPQLELGSFVTSVIPTTTAAATRNFDNADITSISSWFNASEGTLYGQTIFDHLLPLSGSGAFPGIFHIADGTVSNRIVLTAYNPSATNNHYGTVITAGVDQGSLGTNAFAPNTLVKGAFAYKANDTAYCANNSAAVTDNTVTLPTGLNIANLGGTLSVGANRLNGWLQRIKYYPTRLSNAVLQRITV